MRLSSGGLCYIVNFFFCLDFFSKMALQVTPVLQVNLPAPEVVAEKSLATNVFNLLTFAGFSEEVALDVGKALGFPAGTKEELGGVSPSILAMASEAEFNTAVVAITDNFFKKNAATYAWKLAVRLCTTLPPPSLPTSSGPSPGTASLSPASADDKALALRKHKVSNLTDPMDESEVPAASKDQLTTWYANYTRIKFGDPRPEKDPTPEQVQAMHVRIVVHRLEPYADFSILTPFGRRFAKRLKFRSWLPQPDGTYIPLDMPGPESFDQWEKCWAIYETIMIMLEYPPEAGETRPTPVITTNALEEYFENFKQLAKENHNAWWLCVQAEDRCRHEHLPRLFRSMAIQNGKDPSWTEVFIKAANDDKYWDREVRREALRFLARGDAKVPKQDDTEGMPSEGPRKRTRRRGQKTQAGAAAGAAGAIVPWVPPSQTVVLSPGPKGKGKGKTKDQRPHPRKDANGRYTTTREGTQVCFKFANGGACPAPCKFSRAHVCQRCLQPHVNGSPSCQFNG